MKTLYVVRHAKSSWDDPGLDDFDRPLNKRGKKDAPEMGRRLTEKNILPDLMVTSPAKRAKKTAKKIAKKIGYTKKAMIKDERLYHAGVKVIASVISETDEKVNALMIFGHNPGFTDFVNHITDANIDNVPTCGIITITFAFDSWQDIISAKGKVVNFDYPKKSK